MQVITIGSAVIDVFIKSTHFVKDKRGVIEVGSPSGKSDVDSFALKTGGGASNTAVGFSRLGFSAAIISETGQDDLAKLVFADLEAEGVDTTMIIKERREETGGAVIFICADGSRSILVHRGASSQLDPGDLKISELAGADWVHLSSLSGRTATLRHLFTSLKFYGVKTSWNPGSADLQLLVQGKLEISEIQAKVMFVNQEEWEVVDKLQAALIKQIGQVVVTDGRRGGRIFLAGGERHLYPAQKVQSIDSTGAGDAFCVGYVAALLKNQDPETAAAWGAANSASVVQQIGAKAGLRRRLP